MKEKLQLYTDKVKTFWKSRSLTQKSLLAGSVIALLVLVISVSVLASKTNMAPLYSNLSLEEVGQIKEELDTRGITYEISNKGQTILVPSDQTDGLLVDLAAQGLPNSGNIDYSYFSANTSWGMTENEFKVIERDAMQSEIAALISSIDGIQDAKVMINTPEESVFVGEESKGASASVVIQKQSGYTINESQITSLYNLVSKAVPNLSTDNIVISDQNFNYYELKNGSTVANGTTYENQQGIKKNIEKDIQQRVQQMLGMMIGRDKVVVSVTADVDFTQEQRTEELVEPATDEEDSIPVSVERITETYSGNPPVEGGTPGAGEDDVTNYNAEDANGDGDYEMVKETINNEFDKIKRNIVESPYKIRDLGIQVAVDNSKETDASDDQAAELTAQEQTTVQESINSILSSIVTTSIAKEYGEIEPENKISIVFQEFTGRPESTGGSTPAIPKWLYAVGGVLLVIIATLIWLLARRNRSTEIIKEEVAQPEPVSVPDIEEEKETESTVRRKQLERMAKEKPEDFAKLLRSWIADD
ncbi:flagellar basal-body MS-ring/collar protein FliF [Pontibacillus salicampi]|uniref:Flagellar M-ring protein n=1 Tax=Pontibacillus salicampi TaxID=1449801 RepID=A0ABV6LNZ9_9BACI